MNVPVFVLITNLLWSQITISEVMFDLEGSDSPNEFVEIYNYSDEDIVFQNWVLIDNHSTDELIPDGLPFCHKTDMWLFWKVIMMDFTMMISPKIFCLYM